MAQRKVRRVKNRSTTSKTTQKTAPLPGSTSPGEATVSATRRYKSDEEALREEYAYVIDDLRKIAIIAVSMFILLIILGLVL